MFDHCNSLAELNAARTQKVQEDVDVVSINNAYNERRREILASRTKYFQLKELRISPEPAHTCRGLPIVGSSPSIGVIAITMQGILV